MASSSSQDAPSTNASDASVNPLLPAGGALITLHPQRKSTAQLLLAKEVRRYTNDKVSFMYSTSAKQLVLVFLTQTSGALAMHFSSDTQHSVNILDRLQHAYKALVSIMGDIENLHAAVAANMADELVIHVPVVSYAAWVAAASTHDIFKVLLSEVVAAESVLVASTSQNADPYVYVFKDMNTWECFVASSMEHILVKHAGDSPSGSHDGSHDLSPMDASLTPVGLQQTMQKHYRQWH